MVSLPEPEDWGAEVLGDERSLPGEFMSLSHRGQVEMAPLPP